MDGILLVNKPEGLTSHDVVARVRKLSRTRKVGHAGTLDPFATGLLALCLGKATRIVEYLMGCDKEYIATMRLGITTDTQDATGQTIATCPVPDLSVNDLERVFFSFLGVHQQVPPMYSAKKVEGTRLYTLARQGKTVKRAARPVTIHSIDILETALPDIRFRVSCSSGTYIRTLAHDVGESLQCGAHLTALTRTRIGKFPLHDAVSLEELTRYTELAEFAAALMPIDRALTMFPAVTLANDLSQKFTHGMRIGFPANADNGLAVAGCQTSETLRAGQTCRLYSEEGIFLGLGQWAFGDPNIHSQWLLRPRKVLVHPLSSEKP